MTEIRDLIYGVIDRYSNKRLCSRARIIQSIYLTDWWSAVHYGERVCDVSWTFDSSKGPFSGEIMNAFTTNSKLFRLEENESADSILKVMICKIVSESYNPSFDERTREALEAVIAETMQMSWTVFNAFVHSTYPLTIVERGNEINILALANAYRAQSEGGHDNNLGKVN